MASNDYIVKEIDKIDLNDIKLKLYWFELAKIEDFVTLKFIFAFIPIKFVVWVISNENRAWKELLHNCLFVINNEDDFNLASIFPCLSIFKNTIELYYIFEVYRK